MREDLIDKIRQLSTEERSLVLRKFQQTLAQHQLDTSSEKSKRLAAYIQGDGSIDDPQEIKSFLKERLPDYMIPSVITLTDEIPLLPNGKVDKNSLKDLQKLPKKEKDEAFIPSSELEQNLVKIWEDVLNFKPISVNDNFFEIGGDSILSIQIIARARKVGIELSSNELFDHQTIAEIALFAEKQSNSITASETVSVLTGSLSLNPIQRWFFETHKTAPHYWNQAMQLGGMPSLEKSAIKSIIDAIIVKHHSLRSSFFKENDSWQLLLKDPSEIDSLTYIDISDADEPNRKQLIKEQLNTLQCSFDLLKGSLFKCVYFYTGTKEEDICFMVAHHLVIDAVSWQIILDDFRDAIHQQTTKTSITLSKEGSSVLDWATYLNDFAVSESLAKEESFWRHQISDTTPLPKDFDGKLPLIERDIETISSDFSSTITYTLLEEANEPYKTKTDELLLAALTQTIGGWSSKNDVFIGMERHGRETNSTSFDLSNTVGWFTAYFPLKLNSGVFENMEKGIIGIKEQLRTIPNGGIGYGILRYLKRSLKDAAYPEIVFNFLGRQRSIEADQTIAVKPITEATRHPLSERSYALEINAALVDDVLTMHWSYSNTQYSKTTIEKLVVMFEENLQGIITHCNSTNSGKYTPSDFPETMLNQDDLDSLFSTLE